MTDETEGPRRALMAEIAAGPSAREELEREYGQVWDTQELQRDFEVVGFMAPLVCVIRKADRVRGSLKFRHSPRLYFQFEEG